MGSTTGPGTLEYPIAEERLAEKVARLLKLPSIRFYAPPPDRDDPSAPITGITAWLFPEWFVAQYEERDPKTGVRSRPLVHRLALDKSRFIRDKRRYKVVPIRFVQACVRGHVSDINWRVFVHGKEADCTRDLWLDERGTSGDLADITIRCECGARKELSAATKINDAPFGYCNGPRPWLGRYGSERCGGSAATPQVNRLLVRSASNAYFAQTLSVISIPEGDLKVRRAVDEVITDIDGAESPDELKIMRRGARVSAALEGLSTEAVWAELQRRKGGGDQSKPIKEVEAETLLAAPMETGEDVPSSYYYARAAKLPTPRPLVLRPVARLIKVHRLREVIAQIGFTRFEAAVPDVNGELSLEVERAALASDMTWVPAVENRGEGFFLAFDPGRIAAWEKRPAVTARGLKLLAGFRAWESEHPGTKTKFPGLAYVMLHSLSHLLITAVSLECGYAASSIRERVYATDAGMGILLYTASPDAEGTLGGLVEVANDLERLMEIALETGGLCANDPVCAQHDPDNPQEQRHLHGASCHGCLLIAETSCERRNDFLDRSLIVSTVEGLGAEFFGEEGL